MPEARRRVRVVRQCSYWSLAQAQLSVSMREESSTDPELRDHLRQTLHQCLTLHLDSGFVM